MKSDHCISRRVTKVSSHSAGIIPHTFEGKDNGRIIFYGFAGYPVFNFSQAAVLEKFAFSHFNVVLIVVDISKLVKVEGIMYWFQLVSNATKKFPQVIIVGSHADLPPLGRDPKGELSQACNDLSSALTAEYPGSSFSTITHVPLDCRDTKSNGQNKTIHYCFKSDDIRRISSPAVILLQILSEVVEKSFACNVLKVQEYMTKIGVGLSIDTILCWAKELELHGYVLVIRNKTNPSDSWIISDV